MAAKGGVHHQTGTPGILLLPQLLWKLWKGTQDQGDDGTHSTASGQRRNTDTCVNYPCPEQQMEGRAHAVKPTSSAAETKEESSILTTKWDGEQGREILTVLVYFCQFLTLMDASHTPIFSSSVEFIRDSSFCSRRTQKTWGQRLRTMCGLLQVRRAGHSK